ncbi:MAG: hypothetical protein LBM09_01490 [Candidatus Nomurabacteria bacterium]|jgi:DNA polymerase-1|nr:hypothetical protein [Candidatus Nomurabacteria bacterium]
MNKSGEAAKTLVLIDGKSVFYRGYYAMPNLSMRDGTPTGGVYGFAAMALELLNQIKPDYVAVAWDKAKTNIRRRLSINPDYKANRKPAPPDFYAQIPILHELLDAFGWPLYEFDDYEADDIIGTLDKLASQDGLHTIMISSDLDLLQVIDDNTELYALKKGLTNLEKFDVGAFEEKYGLRVDQFLDLKALKGDNSDNIAGVAGIGEKTAVSLLQEFNTLDGAYENLDKIKPAWRTKLEAGRESAYQSKQLAEIWCNAPVDLDLAAMDIKNLNPEKLRAELIKLEFTSLLKRLPDFMKTDDSVEVESEIIDNPSVYFTLDDGKIVVNDGKVLAEKILAEKALDYPNKSGNDETNEVRDNNTCHPEFISGSQENNLEILKQVSASPPSALDSLRINSHESIRLRQNDNNKTWNNKNTALPEIAFDTRIAGFLLGKIQPADTVENLKKLYEEQRAELETMPKLNRLAKQLDFPMQNLLAKIEARGVKIDTQELAKISNELQQKIEVLQQKIWDLAGYNFNISSSPQLSDALFEKLKLPTTGIKKSLRGYFSTGKAELHKLHGQHPIIELISEFREVSKLKNTYTDSLPELVDKNGYLHTDFRQDVTATGRLSSSAPNLQNIPIRTELGQSIRRAFVASSGKVLISADYSQFELRLAAAMAHDEKMIEIFNNDDADIHTLTAAEAFNVEPKDVTPTQRRFAKVINFGVLYGMSPHGLAAATDMSLTDAKKFIEQYFEIRKPIRDFLDKTMKQANDEGYVETLFGRRRATPDVKSRNFMVRESAKRAAANMPIQGTEADLMKMAMLRVEKEIPESDARQILQIHDSIMMECAPEKASEIGVKLKDIMENIYPDLGVKLRVDVKTGQSWADL